MNRLWGICALVFIGSLGCSSSNSGSTGPSTTSGGTPDGGAACATGFTLMADNSGCEPVHPTAACAAGTRASLGSTSCVPVGVTSCSDGFVADSSGWGCAPVLSAAACPLDSGTRERLGSTTCEAISDCSAALPSGPNVLNVDAALADSAVDATHFKTIGAAVAAAPSGATVAVEAGTYVEQLTLPGRPVSIIGRCAEQTIITPPATPTIPEGIAGRSADVLTLSKITMRGHHDAIWISGGVAHLDSVVIEDSSLSGLVADAGAKVDLTNVVIRGTVVASGDSQAFGMIAKSGGSITATDSVFASNQFINVGASDEGSTVTLTRSIVRDGRGFGIPAQYGMGVYAALQAAVTATDTAIVDNSAVGVDMFSEAGALASVTLRGSVILGTKLSPGLNTGAGVNASYGTLVIDQTTIGGSALMELYAADGATLDITSSTLRGNVQTGPDDRGALGLVTLDNQAKAQSLAIVNARAGVEVEGTSTLTLDSSLVQDTRASAVAYENSQWVGLGMMVETTASLSFTHSTMERAHTVGVLVAGKADISDSLLENNLAGLDNVGGRALSVEDGSAVTVERSAFVSNMEAGIVVMMEGASMTVTDSTVQNTALDANGQFGIGLLFGGNVLATVQHCTVTGSAGVGVAVSSAGAALRASTISNNAIGVNAQDGTTLVIGDQDADALSFVVSADTQFIGNQTRVGSGAVPLPTPIAVPAPTSATK